MDHLAQLGGVAHHARQVRRQAGVDDVIAVLGQVEVQNLADQAVQVERVEHGRWRARIVAEVVDHALHGVDLVDDGGGAALEQFGFFLRQAVLELHLHALGRQLDRRERVLDLVRQAPRDFAPGHRALRRDHVRDIVEHDDEAAVGAHRQARAARQQHQVVVVLVAAAAARDLDLLLPVGALAPLGGRMRALGREGARDAVREVFQAGDAGQRPGHCARFHLQDAIGRVVRVHHQAFGVEHDHAGRHIGQHRFEVGLGALQRGAVALDRAPGLEQLAGHGIERLRQRAQFVLGLDDRPRRQVALGHRLRALGQHQQRLRQVAGDEEGAADGAEDRQQQRQGQHPDVHLAQAGARFQAQAVFAVGRAQHLGVRGQVDRHRLQQLQVALRRAGRLGHGQHHAQAQARDGVERARDAVEPLFAQVAIDAAFGQRIPARHRGALEHAFVGRVGREVGAAVFQRRGQHRALLVDQHRALQAAGVGQQPRQHRLRAHVALARQGRGGGLRGRAQFGQRFVERGAAQVQARLDRRLDLDVEPRVDRMRDEIHRHHEDDDAGQDADAGEQQHQSRHQARAELAGLVARIQAAEGDRDEGQQHEGHRADQSDQPAIVAAEEFGIGRGRCEQEQQDAHHGAAHDEGIAQDLVDRSTLHDR